MKDWVKSFLTSKLYKERKHKFGKDKDTAWKKEYIEGEFRARYSTEEGICVGLAECLRLQMYGDENSVAVQTFIKLLGSVLGEVPEEVFRKIVTVENVFFGYNPLRQTSAWKFDIPCGNPQGGEVRFINFFYETPFMPPAAAKGEIVVGLMYSVWDKNDPVTEDDIKRAGKDWGFTKEIDAWLIELDEGAAQFGGKEKITA